MKLLFLGTGAADWPPERPDGCEEFRRMSAALIDGTLLIDPGPQVPVTLLVVLAVYTAVGLFGGKTTLCEHLSGLAGGALIGLLLT